MEALLFEPLGNVTQNEYLRIVRICSGALRTKSKYIEVCGQFKCANGDTIYRVRLRGVYYYHIAVRTERFIGIELEI